MAAFGVNAPVVASVLSIFMLGLSVGSFFAGLFMRKIQNSSWLGNGLRTYGMLELIIACGGILVPSLIFFGRQLMLSVPMLQPFHYFALCFVVIFSILIPFCAAMGGTFPIIISYVERISPSKNHSHFSLLYLINVSGAISGVILSAFFLIEFLGFEGTLLAAFFINISIAVLAIWQPFIKKEQRFGFSKITSFTYLYEEIKIPKDAFVILFLLGMCSLGLEVVWMRLYVPYAGTEVYSFAAMLGIYLFFTSFGTLFYRTLREKQVFWLAAFLLSPSAVTSLLSSDYILKINALWRLAIGIAPFSFITGMLTPFLIDFYTKSKSKSVGMAYAANLFGCVIGPLLAGFVLIPIFGNRMTCFIFALVLWIINILLFQKSRNFFFTKVIFSGLGIILCFLAFICCRPFEMQFPAKSVKHDYAATVVAVGEGMHKELFVNGQPTTFLTTITKMMSHLPLAHLESNRRSLKGLVIGLGMGTSFRSMMSWGIDSTAIELVPSVVQFFPYFFNDAKVLLQRFQGKTRIIVDDGRRFLDRSNQLYDVIVIDPPPPVTQAASSLLYSKDFYKTIKKRLARDGILQTWVPEADTETIAAITQALFESFPYVRIFHSIEGWGLHYLASESPIQKLSAAQLAARLSPATHKDLTEWSSQTPEILFETVLKNEVFANELIRSFRTKKTIPLTDDRPVNEYYFFRALIRKYFDKRMI